MVSVRVKYGFGLLADAFRQDDKIASGILLGGPATYVLP